MKDGGGECFLKLDFGSYETATSLQGSTCWKAESTTGSSKTSESQGVFLVECEEFASESSTTGSDTFIIMIVQRKCVTI